MENKILSACYTDREAFEVINNYIDKEKDLSEIGKILYSLAEEFYKRDTNVKQVDVDLVKEVVNSKYEKHKDILCSFIDNLVPCSIPNVVGMVRDNKLGRLASEISAAAGRGDNNKVSFLVDKYTELRDTFREVDENDPFDFKGSLYYIETKEGGERLDILPKSVNEHLGGGLSKQHHVLIFGVPEVGKSLLTVTIACGFIRQGKKVLYVGNEDPERSMRDRIRCCLLNCTKEELYNDNPEDKDRLAEQKGYGRLGFSHLSPGSLRDVRSLCARYSPDILIVDQVRNLRVPLNKEGSKVTQIEIACQGIRNIAQEYNLLAISVTQAADSAYNKLVLDMGDVYFSNTGAQAHADVMIGIGCNDEFENQGQRMLSFPKNKINGKHGHQLVKVYPQISKMVSI